MVVLLIDSETSMMVPLKFGKRSSENKKSGNKKLIVYVRHILVFRQRELI